MGVVYAPDGGTTQEQQPQQQPPQPGFEGYEKRLEVEFYPPKGASKECKRWLRDLPRPELVAMLTAAECSIVAELSNADVDSYVLSESSLFVYPTKLVLKTCGTTKLLAAIPLLLSSAAKLSMQARRCKYTRGTFIFPSAQPAPYGNFNEEVALLKRYFGHLGDGGKAYVMGDVSRALNWHIYVAAAADSGDDVEEDAAAATTAAATAATTAAPDAGVYTLEMCMTQLDRSSASVFFKSCCSSNSSDSSMGASEMTQVSGIRELLPESDICDFAFDPCGYSMNSVQDSAHSTIHVTPEPGFSYASFESMGYGPGGTVQLTPLVDAVLSCFKPAVFSACVSVVRSQQQQHDNEAEVEEGDDDYSWAAPLSPRGYWCSGSSLHELPGGCLVVYHTFSLLPNEEDDEEQQDDGAGVALASATLPLPLTIPKPETNKKRKNNNKKQSSFSSGGGSLDVMARSSNSGDNKRNTNKGMELSNSSCGGRMQQQQQQVEWPPAVVNGVQPVDDDDDDVVQQQCTAKAAAAAEGVVAIGGMGRAVAAGAGTEMAAGAAVVEEYVREVAASGREAAFYVMDVAVVLRLWRQWAAALPRVRPFYAVKCNPDARLLRLLAALGAGFDVASRAEMEAVAPLLSAAPLQSAAERVIFANPCKLPSHMAAAAAAGVVYTTYDSVGEVGKVAAHFPAAALLLRLRCDDGGARCQLGGKYGALPHEWAALLAAAAAAGLRVAGVAFHVGSGAAGAAAYADGIRAARAVFDMAAAAGLPPLRVLDIGGGFVSDGGGGVALEDAAAAVNGALAECFPDPTAVTVIAEPGRFFAEEAFSLAAHVFGRRFRSAPDGGALHAEYWVNDGIYGSMNCLLYDHARLSVRPIRLQQQQKQQLQISSLLASSAASSSSSTLSSSSSSSLVVIDSDDSCINNNNDSWCDMNNTKNNNEDSSSSEWGGGGCYSLSPSSSSSSSEWDELCVRKRCSSRSRRSRRRSSSSREEKAETEELLESTVFGPTCDGLDTVLSGVVLPRLEEGDWLLFPRMGAYTKAAASAFNGFSVDDISTFYVHSGLPCRRRRRRRRRHNKLSSC